MAISLITGNLNASVNQINDLINHVNSLPTVDTGATELGQLTDCHVDYDNENMLLGLDSGSALVDGTENTSLGSGALLDVEDGIQNSALGKNALLANTDGHNNVAVGCEAGATNETGSGNTYIGKNADADDVDISNATAIGQGAVVSDDNTVQIGNEDVTDVYFGDETAILHADGSALTNLPATGATALDGLTDAITNYPAGNMFVGSNSGINRTTGTNDTALGYQALKLLADGDNNTAIGQNALILLESGDDNTAVGFTALENNTSSANTAVGSAALGSNQGGDNNTAVGKNAAFANTSGFQNVAVGTGSGAGCTTGNYNVMLGSGAGLGTSSLSECIAIGHSATANNANTWIVGKLGTKQCIEEGSNAAMGVATLIGGTVTVSNTLVTANSRIFITGQDDNGGTPGFLRVSARSAATSFTITSSNGSDTSIVAWEIKEPN